MSLQATYELRLKDHSGAIVARFPGIGRSLNSGGGLRSFSYRKRLRTSGGANTNIYANDTRITQHLKPVENFLDYQWEVWRNDPLDAERGLYKDHEWFHRGEELSSSDDGLQIYRSYGQGYNILFSSDVIDYKKGTPQAEKTGDSTTIALEYIDENIGANAGVDSDGFSRVRPGLQIATAVVSGKTYSEDFAGELLSDVLAELADFSRYEYMIEGDGPASFIVNWRERPYGEDRREGNAFGNVPVIFESQRANITNTTQAKQFLNAITSVSVRGAGVGDQRIIANANDANALTFSPWARRCVTRTANKEADTTILQNIGVAIINHNESKTRSTFTYRQTQTTRYGRDWNVGDFVTTIDDLGLRTDMNIVGVTVSFSSEGVETIVPELEEIINDN